MLKLTLLALVLALALPACGRRGALEAPGRPETAAIPAVSEPAPVPGNEGSLLDPESAGSQEPAQDRPTDAPDRPFFLDPLI
jgi:predicted small lipoprotein YifL